MNIPAEAPDWNGFGETKRSAIPDQPEKFVRGVPAHWLKLRKTTAGALLKRAPGRAP